MIKLFVEKGLLDRSFALKILSWKQSGFSVDNSIPILASNRKARVNLSQYIIRHPVSLQKILYARSNGTIIYKTRYNEYFKENIKLFKAGDFIARLYRRVHPAHPTKAQAPWQSSGLHAIMACIPADRRVRPSKMGALQSLGIKPHPERNPPKNLRRRLYQTRPHGGAGRGLFKRCTRSTPSFWRMPKLHCVCEKCGHEMKVIAVITNSHVVSKILECLKRNHAPPFDKVEIKAS